MEDKDNKKSVENSLNKSTEKFKEIMTYYHGGKRELAIEMACNELSSFIHYKINKEYSAYLKYYEDMYNQGICGVLEGLKKYDPALGAPTTFFNFYIVHEISRFVDQFAKRTTSYYASNIATITRAQEKFDSSGKEYTEMDIARVTGLNLDTIHHCLKLMTMTNEMYIESEDFIESQISEKTLSPEEEYLKKEKTEALQKALSSLGEDAEIIAAKYGMDGTNSFKKELSDREVAKRFGIPVDRVKRARHNAIRKLRNMPELRSLFYDHLSDAEALMEENSVSFVPRATAEKIMDEYGEFEIDF